MDVIIKKAIKDFKSLGWRSWLIVGTIILSLGGGLGLYYGTQAALPMLDNYFDSVNHADYTYQLADDTWITQAQLDGFKNLDEVDDYTGRLLWTTSLQLPGQDDRKYVLLVGLDYKEDELESPDVYKYNIQEGDNFDPNDNNISVVIDEVFAEKNDIEIDDKIKIDGLNNAKVKVYGTCNSPELAVSTSNPEFLFPAEGSMAVMYLSKDTLKNYIRDFFIWYNTTTAEDLTPQILYYNSVDYNSIAVTFKDDLDDGDDQVEEYLENVCGVDIEKGEAFEDSYAYSLMKADVGDSGEIMMILMYFMVFVGGLIVYVIFNRYVYSQKQQIGILLGLGYTKKDIIKYFLFNILVISLISIPSGIVVGYVFGYIMLNQMMGELASVDPFSFPFLYIPEILYLGIILGTTTIFLSTFFSVRKVGKKLIAELIYEQEEVAQKIKKPKESQKPRNITNKLVFKNLFRNKKRMAFTMVAMTFSLLIVSASQSLLDSMYYNVDITFKSRKVDVQAHEIWDLNVLFTNEVNNSRADNLGDQIKDMRGVDDVVVYSKGLAKAHGEDNQEIIIQGIDFDDGEIHNFAWADTNAENRAPEKDDEIAISSVHALKLNKKLGDKVRIENAAGEDTKFEIVGIHFELVMTVYISKDAGYKLIHNNSKLIDGVYVILDEDADRDKIIEKIYDKGNIEVIFDIYDMNEKGNEFIDNYAVLLIIISSYTLMVSFFIVFYNAVMNIYDKNYEYGILRSLGYSKRKVHKMILIENFFQGLLPILLAVAFTFPLTYQLALVYEDNFPLAPIVGIPALLMVIIPPIFLYTLGSLVGLHTVYKQNLYEQVQTRFVG